jgi:hypothetical protein
VPNQFGEITDRGLSQALQRRFGVDPNLSLSLMPELGATIDLGDAPELRFHAGWRRWQASATIAALAANAAIVRIQGPQSLATGFQPNLMIVVEKIQVSSSVATQVLGKMTAFGSADLTTVIATMIPRDFRQNPTPSAIARSQATVSTDRLALITGTGIDFLIPANDSREVPGAPWVINPGWGLDVGCGTVNQPFSFTIVFRERFMNDQENAA